MQPRWRWLTRRKLRIDILTIFAFLITFIFIAIIGYTYLKTSRVILELGSVVIEKSASAVVKRFDDYVSPAALFEYSTALLDDGWLDNDDKKKLSSFMQILLKTHPQLTSAYVADDHNNMFVESRVYRDPGLETATLFLSLADVPKNAEYVSEMISRENGKTLLSAIFKTKEGKIIGEKKDIVVDFVPHEQSWFKGAMESSSHNWIVINNYPNDPGMQMTVSQAIKFHGKDIGVIAVDVNVDVMSQYLQEYHVSRNSQTFVIDHTDKVVATLSHLKRKEDVLPKIEDLKNNILSKAHQVYVKTRKRDFVFKLNGVEYLTKVVPYALIKDVGWEIITIVPTDDFIAKAKKDYRDIILVSFLMLFIGLVLVLIFSHKISRPIMKLARDTRQINKLIFDQPTIIKSHIYEIQILTDAFNATKQVLSSFAKYIPKALLDKLIHTGAIASVGGERKEISVLFSDIRNFTTIAEKIPPEELMVHVSEYLNAVTRVIHQFNGNVDKFIGDSVMAFWGAPLSDEAHAEHACMAALMCHYQINKLNEIWEKMGKPVFYTRFGINTGMTVVGNMGSFDRLNYTAIGDEVNLAARLEQINKFYGTQIIVSQSVYLACKDKFLFRPVDIVLVKGKTKSTCIYELVAANFGPVKIRATDQQKELCELTTMAYEAYTAGKLDLSKSLYESLLIKFPEDPIAIFYLKRLME